MTTPLPLISSAEYQKHKIHRNVKWILSCVIISMKRLVPAVVHELWKYDFIRYVITHKKVVLSYMDGKDACLFVPANNSMNHRLKKSDVGKSSKKSVTLQSFT